jgi:cytochrome c oxidase subunit 3
MADHSAQGHETYYVPESSPMAVLATIGLITTTMGAAMSINQASYGGGSFNAWYVFWTGLIFFSAVLFTWFRQAIRENIAGMNSPQLKRSYVIGMQWFIFSEVMFFFAFFGALFYIRNLSGPWLASEGVYDMNYLLWGDFSYSWPLMETPQEAIGGATKQLIANNGVFAGPDQSMAFPGWANIFKWLPLWNTCILLTSSYTCHVAHHKLKVDNDRKGFNLWLGITVLLGIIFLALQVFEYYEAYAHYGTTFFMLTGFHGFHVAMGMGMLLVQWLRSVKGGHFTQDDHFGFEASSWYWHFVDVVWVGLFLFVYIL